MFLHKIYASPLRRWARPLAISAAILTFSALCLTGCGPKAVDSGTGKAEIAVPPGAPSETGQAAIKDPAINEPATGKSSDGSK